MSPSKTKVFAVAATLGAALAGEALAVPLPLPAGGTAPLTPGTVGGPVLASLTDPFSNLLYSGEVQSWVYDDPAWAAGLTFVYQVRLNPDSTPDIQEIHRLSTYGWTSFAASVEQDPAAGDAGTTADRNAGGGTIGFNIPAGFFEGENSALFIVRTDADAWKGGIGGVINGQSSNLELLAPDRAHVPDAGSSALLLSAGLFGLAGIRRFAR